MGFAISKYTFAAPVVLILLVQREFRVLVVAALTQAAAFLGLALITQASPWQLILDYNQFMRTVFVDPESWGHAIQLARLFPNNDFYSIVVPVSLVLIAVGFAGWYVYFKRGTGLNAAIGDMHLFTFLSLWALLVVYHGDYDAILYFFFFVLLLIGWCYPGLWRLNRWQAWGLAGLAAVLGVVATSLFTRGLDFISPNAPDITPQTITISVLMMLVVSLILTYRAAKIQLLPANVSTLDSASAA